MKTQKLSSLALLASALLLNGCLFSAEAPTDENSDANNSVVILEDDGNNANSGEPDMELPEDMDEPELDCEGDEDCDPGQTCNDDNECEDIPGWCGGDDDCEDGQACNDDNECEDIPGWCESDDACGPGQTCNDDNQCEDIPGWCERKSDCAPNEGCFENTCVDLLSNPEHCGALNRACPPGSDCVAGMCTCGQRKAEGNHSIIATTSDDQLQHYPEPGLFYYTSPARFRCADGTDALPCPMGVEIVTNEDYPPTAPHYIAAYASAKDTISFKSINEWGQPQPGQAARLRGQTDLAGRVDERTAWRYEVTPTGAEGSLLWVLWLDEQAEEGAPNSAIRAYVLEPDDSKPQDLDITQFYNEMGEPVDLVEGRGIVDFTAALQSFATPMGSVEVAAFPYIQTTDAPDGALPRAGLQVRAYITERMGLQKREYTISLDSGVDLGELRQIGGFSAELILSGDDLILSVTPIAEHNNDEDVPDGYLGGIFKQHLFVSTRDPNTGSFTDFAPLTPPRALSWGIIPEFQLLSLALGDQSELPPPMLSFLLSRGAAPTKDNWFHLGWVRKPGDRKQRAVFEVNATGKDATSAPLPLYEVADRGVYDTAYLFNEELPFILWLEADVDLLGNFNRKESSLNYAALLEAPNDNAPPTFGEVKQFGEAFGAHRLALQYSERAVGVLAHGQVDRQGNEHQIRFYNFTQDGRPICNQPPQ